VRLHRRGPVPLRLQGPRRGSFEAPGSDDEILWVDLDLDFEITADEVDLQDEDQFHDHALSMGYPDHVVRRRRTCPPT
jgi:hypothetical protein